MQRSSESVAALASALAKAQAELVNPEKSLTAIIRTGRPGEGERSFRYAPLSSGLDIVRKTLGQHEIATVQTTAIDKETGVVSLTTMLAHASGEWIASDWPVCPVAETANPQRMGAALTYARRYALFTLVGIAGEDDLDAPNLCDPLPTISSQRSSSGGLANLSQVRPELQLPSRSVENGRAPAAVKSSSRPVLSPDESAALRDRLLAEIATLPSEEGATTWSRGALPAKNQLSSEDAKRLENAFEKKWSELSALENEETSTHDLSQGPERLQEISARDNQKPDQIAEVVKSVLMLNVPRRHRNREHLRFVSQQPCLLCGRKPSDAHHIKFVQPRALGRKSSDEFAVPLCRSHHRAVHRVGDEQSWWKQAGIDPVKVARKLWKRTRVDEGRHPADTVGQTIPSRPESDSAGSATSPPPP